VVEVLVLVLGVLLVLLWLVLGPPVAVALVFALRVLLFVVLGVGLLVVVLAVPPPAPPPPAAAAAAVAAEELDDEDGGRSSGDGGEKEGWSGWDSRVSMAAREPAGT
jgi:hypothetical protein